MAEYGAAGAYVLDAEAFAALRRLVAKFRGDGVFSGDERRNVANRMNALLQKAQPESSNPGRQNPIPGCSNDVFWVETDQPFGKM